MKSFTFRAKMVILLGIILIVFLLFGWLMHNATKASNNIIQHLYEGSISNLEKIQEIDNNLLTEVQMPVQLMRTEGLKDQATAYQIRSGIKNIRKMLFDVRNSDGFSSGQKAILTDMSGTFDKIASDIENILNFKGDITQNKVREQWRQLFDHLNRQLKIFSENAEKFAKIQAKADHTMVGNMRKSLKNRSKTAMIAIIIGLLIVLIFPLLFITDITTKYKLVIKYLVNLSKGNLTDDIPDIAHDEMGWILRNVRILQQSLRKITEEVNTAAGNLSIASHDLSASSQSIAQGASEQASSVEEISSSIEELASNIHQVSDNAKATETIANKLADTTDIMVSEARKSQEKMTSIAEKVGIINEIAFQTNILALNAAVEAARAGEHGRGFGVVAVEVGKLAERSKKAAAEIEELIHSSVDVIEKAGQIMMDVAPEVNKTADMVKSISEASMEQKMGADQISDAIQQLNEVTQQNAAASEEIATSAEELSAQADRLVEAQSFFKMEEHPAPARHPHQTVAEPKKKIPQTVTTGKKSGKQGVDIDLGKPDDLDDGYERF
jgi:methyl-accepting chemotaxis protein